jgi:hypothetical protein
MQPKEFHIPTTWRIKGRVEQVYDVLSRPREFPRRWQELERELARQAAF